MSETEDRTFRVTWRSLPPSGTPDPAEFLEELEVTAAYHKRDGDLRVFKKVDGTITFTVAEDLLETILLIEDAEVTA